MMCFCSPPTLSNVTCNKKTKMFETTTEHYTVKTVAWRNCRQRAMQKKMTTHLLMSMTTHFVSKPAQVYKYFAVCRWQLWCWKCYWGCHSKEKDLTHLTVDLLLCLNRWKYFAACYRQRWCSKCSWGWHPLTCQFPWGQLLSRAQICQFPRGQLLRMALTDLSISMGSTTEGGTDLSISMCSTI